MSEKPLKVFGEYSATPEKELQLRDVGTEFYGRRLQAYCTEREAAQIQEALQSMLLGVSQAEWDKKFEPEEDADPPVTRKELADLLVSIMRLLEGNAQGGEDHMRVKRLWKCTYALGRGEDARGEGER